MATIFLCYQRSDIGLANVLERRLTLGGHIIQNPAQSHLSGDWRSKLEDALYNADVAVFVLTQEGLESPYVLQKLGFSRALGRIRRHLTVAIAPEELDLSRAGSNLECHRYQSRNMMAADRAVDEVIKTIAERGPIEPRIFISHRHADENFVSRLVSLLEAAFEIMKGDVRCTSVAPYTLPGGSRTSDRLRSDLNAAEVVIGVVGPEVAESRYVLFELGASWGRGVATVPILIRGATASDIPGPLGENIGIQLNSAAKCLQLIDDIADRTSIARRNGVAARVAEEAEAVAKAGAMSGVAVSTSQSVNRPADARTTETVMSKHIVNYLNAHDFSMMSFQRIREGIDPSWSDDMLRGLIDAHPKKFRHARIKGGLPGLGLVVARERKAADTKRRR